MPPPTPNAEPSRPATNPVPHITQIVASNKVLSDMVASVVTVGQLKSVVVDTCQIYEVRIVLPDESMLYCGDIEIRKGLFNEKNRQPC